MGGQVLQFGMRMVLEDAWYCFEIHFACNHYGVSGGIGIWLSWQLRVNAISQASTSV
jgi:hypothetical protein